MENRNLERAVEIYAKLITGEQVSSACNADLYEAYESIAGVYDLVHMLLKKSNLKLYEYKQALYVTSGVHNRVFGFTNDDLKKAIGLRVNKELFLAYYIIYTTVTMFYTASSDLSSREYIRAEELIEAVTAGLYKVSGEQLLEVMSDTEKESFQTIAVLWHELPLTAANEDSASLKAARGSKLGMIKLVFNFLSEQQLFLESGGKYYALDRFRAMVQNYYDDERGRLYEILNEGGDAHAAYEQNSCQ